MSKDDRKNEARVNEHAEPRIPFDEFAQTTGLSPVMLAGMRVHVQQQKGGLIPRTQREWMSAYDRFATSPA